MKQVTVVASSDAILFKPGFHKANFGNDNNQFWVKTKQLVWRMAAQSHNRFVFCVVIVEFAVNGNQALWSVVLQ